jgi:hypothetical protein
MYPPRCSRTTTGEGRAGDGNGREETAVYTCVRCGARGSAGGRDVCVWLGFGWSLTRLVVFPVATRRVRSCLAMRRGLSWPSSSSIPSPGP